MRPTCVFNCFKLCLILVCIICKADAVDHEGSADSTSAVNPLDIDNENKAAVADEMINSNEINDPVQDDDLREDKPIDDENENGAQDDVQDGGEELINKGVHDIGELGEKADKVKNTDIHDLTNENLNEMWPTRLDKTYQIPAFKLSPTEIKIFKIWPEAKVQYFIDEFSYDKVLRDKIRGYLDYAQRLTNIDFQELTEPPKDENERWVFFVNRRGQLDCKDYSTKSFTNSGVQKVTVGYDCLRHGGPMAAIVLALLGVPPQHNSPDSRKFITINGSNILPEKSGLFKLLENDEWLFHDFHYDYNSAGHYPAHKYTANGDRTIDIRKDKYETGSHRFLAFDNIINTEEPKDYSPGDINKIASLYNHIILGKAKKGLKLEDCKALYRAVPGFGNTRMKQLKEIPERPKPKQYLAAVKKLFGHKDMFGEALSSLEDK